MIFDCNVENLESSDGIRSDLHISALGFETRSMCLIRSSLVHADRILFLKFPDTDLFSYRENVEVARSRSNGDIIEYSESDFLSRLRGFFSDLLPRSVSLDISSMNRTMISAVISCLARLETATEISIFYVPANYKSPNVSYSDLFSAGPVLPEFSAFDDESDLPSTVLMGLGYEYGVGLGLINLIEPENAICMFAKGHDRRYEDSVRRANLDFRFPGTNASAVAYDLFDPVSTYQYVSATVRNLLPKYRVSLIPMGPKILASIFVLAAVEHLGDVTLWRVVRNAPPTNATDDGLLVRFSVDSRVLLRSADRYKEVFEFS